MKENICTAAGVIGGFFCGTARRMEFGSDHACAIIHGYRLHNRTDRRIYGQKQTQQDWQTQLQGRLGRTCKEVLHSAHGRCGRPHGHHDRYHIYS